MTTTGEIPARSTGDSWGERRLELAVALALVAAGLGLRVLACFHHPVEGEETQCLHVAWCWTQGLLHYRDAADSQMPLFQMLCAPMLRMAGERADVAAIMRLWMLPLFAMALWCVYRIGRALFSQRGAMWAAAFVSIGPSFHGATVEFRPETLWVALWLWAVAVLVEGRLTTARGLLAGFILGAATAVSLKTTVLIFALGLAAPATVLMLPKTLRRGAAAQFSDRASAAFAGFVVVPAAVAGVFLASDAIGALYQSTFVFNLIASVPSWRVGAPVCLALLPVFWWMGWLILHGSPEIGIGMRRAMLVCVCGVHLALSRSPLPGAFGSESCAALLPLLAIFFAAAIVAVARWLGCRVVTPYSRPADTRTAEHRGELEFGLALMRTRLRRWQRVARDYLTIRTPAEEKAREARRIEMALLTAAAVALAGVTIKTESPWMDAAAPHRGLLEEVFRLTRHDETVMDVQGETVFRRRPFVHLLDAPIRNLMARELVADTIPDRLMEARTCVVAADDERWPGRARLFMMKNYLPVGRLRVAGFFLAAPRTATRDPRVFDVMVAARYVVVGETGPVAGALDGQPMTGAVFLKPGRYAFQPDTATGRLALFWASAFERGFSPFWK